MTPDTILRWHHRLIKMKWTYPSKRVGRPGIMKLIREQIVRMASDNSSWGYCRIQGELKKLDHRVARSTIAKTLKDNGIRPAPERSTSWRTFLKAHADVIVGADFFTTEVYAGPSTRNTMRIYYNAHSVGRRTTLVTAIGLKAFFQWCWGSRCRLSETVRRLPRAGADVLGQDA